MTNLIAGPFYATALADEVPPPYSTLVNATNATGAPNGAYAFDQGLVGDVYFSPSGIPPGSTFVSLTIEHYGYANVSSGYVRYRKLYPVFSATQKTFGHNLSVNWQLLNYSLAEVGGSPDPSAWNSSAPLFYYKSADGTPGQMYTDAFRLYITYTPPNQAISPQPVVIRTSSPTQSVSKADPTDPIVYTNEVRGGDLVTKARVDAVRYGAVAPTEALAVGNIWLDSAGVVRLWDGTNWKYVLQPDSVLLGSVTERDVKASDWQTILAAELPDVPDTWGFSWLVVGLTDGSLARVRLNQDDTKVWSLSNQSTFGYFESAGVYGTQRYANSTTENLENTTFVMPTVSTLIEFQVKRVSEATANHVSSFTLWAHPR